MLIECPEHQHLPPSRGGNHLTLRLRPITSERLRVAAKALGRTEIGLAEELLEGALCDLAPCEGG